MSIPGLHHVPPPNLLGMPAKFNRWRLMQAEAVWAAMESNKRCVIQAAPVGFGKSLVYLMQAVLEGKRVVILTSTNALLDQVYREFAELGLIEVRGLGTYDCLEGGPTGMFGDMRREGYRADRGIAMKCDEAPCQSGAWCPRRQNGCLYYDANRRASNLLNKIIITNYAYWMSINKYGEGLGNVDILVMDEAHEAMDELNSFVGTSLRPSEVEGVLGASLLPEGSDAIDWRAWASHWLAVCLIAIEELKRAVREAQSAGENKTGERVSYGTFRRVRELKRLEKKLQTIVQAGDDWIIDYTQDDHGNPIVKFDPVWPGQYAESTLFLNVKKLVMVSATIRPWTAMLLGVNADDIDFREYPSSFPKANRPIIYAPAQAMNRNAVAKYGVQAMIDHLDNIIGRRLDRKGIVHTVSYHRAREMFRYSRFRHMMVMHDNTNTKDIIKEFKSVKNPCILVSPVVDTGYDFPYTEAEYQIIVKVPFPVTVDKIMKARAAIDKSYKDRVTITKLMQMVGRICRAEDDRGETIIIDADFGWWWERYGRQLAAYWFNEAVRYELQLLSMPLPKLTAAA